MMRLSKSDYNLLAQWQLARLLQVAPQYAYFLPKVENRKTLLLSSPGDKCGYLIAHSREILEEANIILGVTRLEIFNLGLLQRTFSLQLQIDYEGIEEMQSAILERAEVNQEEINQDQYAATSTATSTSTRQRYIPLSNLGVDISAEELADLEGVDWFEVAEVGPVIHPDSIDQLEENAIASAIAKVKQRFSAIRPRQLGDYQNNGSSSSSEGVVTTAPQTGRKSGSKGGSRGKRSYTPKTPEGFRRGQNFVTTIINYIKAQPERKWQETLELIQSGDDKAKKCLAEMASKVLMTQRRTNPDITAAELIHESQSIKFEDLYAKKPSRKKASPDNSNSEVETAEE